MNPASAIRPVVIPGTPTEETKQPKNKQDYDNGPQHEITPFELFAYDDDYYGWWFE
jgi:hypothetical protein